MICVFQSAPRSRDRGDLASRAVAEEFLRFNPRPGLATGATIPPARRR